MAIYLPENGPREGLRSLFTETKSGLISVENGDYINAFDLPNGMGVPTAIGIVLSHNLPDGLAFWAGAMTAQHKTNQEIVQMTGTYPLRENSAQAGFPSIGTRVIEECQRIAHGMRPDKTCPTPTIMHECRLYGIVGSRESRESDFTVSGISENGNSSLELYYPQNSFLASQETDLTGWWTGVSQKIAQSQLRVVNPAS